MPLVLVKRQAGAVSSAEERLPYKQVVTGSIPVSPTNTLYGVVAQSVRVSACHAEGREFESRQPRHLYGEIAQLVEQGTENPRVPSSTLGLATIFKRK